MHVSHLLGREFADSPIPVISDEEVLAFEQRKRPGPSKEDFRVHLAGSLKSSWNKQAAALFAEDFVRFGLSRSQDAKKVQKMFLTHLVTLRTQYRQQLRTGEELTQAELDMQTDENRDQRRRGVRIQNILQNICLSSVFCSFGNDVRRPLLPIPVSHSSSSFGSIFHTLL